MESKVIGRMNMILGLLVVNAVAVIALTVVLAVGMLPKAERGVQVAERMEQRFQGFADHVEPVVVAGAGKTIEAIGNMDAGEIATHATEGVSGIVDSAAERAKQLLQKKNNPEDAQK